MDPFDFAENIAAPRFMEDFKLTVDMAETDKADEYFDVPESNSFEEKENVYLTPKNKTELKEKFFTPMVSKTPKVTQQVLKDITTEVVEVENEVKRNSSAERVIKKAKRGTWAENKKGESQLKIKQTFEGIDLIPPTPPKNHSMLTRQDVNNSPRIELRTRAVNRELLKRKLDTFPKQEKYSSLAEKLFHFHRDTPPRFRSKIARPSTAPQETAPPKIPKLSVTMAQSPKLATKLRARTLRPVKENEENQQFKANPLNKNVFKVPSLNKPAPGPSTVPKPFNLTQIKAKEPPKKVVPFRFKAQPAPRASIMNISTASKSSVQSDGSNTDFQNSNAHSGVYIVSNQQKVTKFKPFSFEERNKQQQLVKEEKLKKIIEEKSKVPKFHARPVPSYLNKKA